MRIVFQRTNSPPKGYTTLGYWHWTEPNNKGTLVIIVRKMPWRFEIAVWGHEIVESIYCWIMGITTEECDRFDDYYEEEYKSGRIPITEEGGCDPRCPYHNGHMLGIAWERVWITLTLAGWRRYEIACNQTMGIA